MGVSHLLDTHVLLWLLAEPARVAAPVLDTLGDPQNTLLVSAVTGLEIATKIRVGKLSAPGLVATLPQRLNEIGATLLPVTMDHTLLAGSLTWSHRDPFDRLLVSQATVEGATLVTVDQAMTSLPVPRILTW